MKFGATGIELGGVVGRRSCWVYTYREKEKRACRPRLFFPSPQKVIVKLGPSRCCSVAPPTPFPSSPLGCRSSSSSSSSSLIVASCKAGDLILELTAITAGRSILADIVNAYSPCTGIHYWLGWILHNRFTNLGEARPISELPSA